MKQIEIWYIREQKGLNEFKFNNCLLLIINIKTECDISDDGEIYNQWYSLN
jgi:hypothetical protein